MTHQALIELELNRRNALVNSLFPEQLAAIRDPSPKKVIWTTRRAGKTTTVLTDFFDDASRHDNYRYIYIALTHPSAKDIAWPILHELDRKFNLNCKFNIVELRCTLPNGSSIKLYGADRPGWMPKLYGQKIRGIAVDEAGFFNISLYDLINDILEPCVSDLDGFIYLTSIPGHLPRGLFFDATRDFKVKDKLRGVKSPRVKGWSIHRWTTEDNPYMAKQFLKKIAELKLADSDVEKEPWFIRNYLGGWATEASEQVYKYDDDKNTIEEYEKREGDNFILGIDFGWDDKTAFSIICFNENDPVLYELESYAESEMMLDKIADQVESYRNCYPDLKIVGDPAHKQIFEEFRRRYSFPVVEGEKPQKFEWITTINADYAASRIKILAAKKSQHVAEMQALVWKVKPNGWKVEQPGMDNDCCDAFMLAYRYGYHYRYEEEPKEPKAGTKEFYERIEQEMLEDIEEEFNQQQLGGFLND